MSYVCGCLTFATSPASRTSSWLSPQGRIDRPKRGQSELDSVVKVDQFRSYLLDRDVSTVQVLKFVGTDTLESFGRQLVGLHRPARIDWSARFGLAAPAPSRATEDTPARRPWVVKYDGPCSSCGKTLVKGTPAVWRQAERRMLCMECSAT